MYNRCRTLFAVEDGVRVPVRSTGVIVDVTERKASEERLRRGLANLELFLGVIGHDVRNPLAAILMSAVAGELATQDSQLRRVFAQITTSGRRIEEMIAQLLDISKMRAGQLGLAVARTDLGVVGRECMTEIECGYPGAAFTFRVVGDAVGVWDPVRLRQAISNVLRNAIQHAQGGPKADVVIEGPGDVVAICVRNRGSVAPHLLPVLFEPFRHAGGAGGHGLGLYITREIVTAHGGDLVVESTEASGTSVTIRLPREVRAAVSGEPR